MFLRTTFSAAVLFVSLGAPLAAATVSTTGGSIIAAPASVTNTTVINTMIEGFDERQDVLLTSALTVDGGVIAAGKTVDSHMIFLNKENGGSGNLAFGLAGTPAVTFTFDGTIIGVMSDPNGTLEAASTPILGAFGSIYEAPFSARGMEGNNVATKTNDWYSISGNTISLGMNVTQPGDWIRVVTEVAPVPVPAAGLLLPFGLGALAFMRRRRKQAA